MDTTHQDAIAIVSLVTKFAGIDSAAELWELLRSERESTRRLTAEELRQAGIENEAAARGYVPVTGSMTNVASFDARLFGFTNREAEVADPQLRIFLQGAWEALELAGYDSRQFDGRIGVFASAHLSTYFMHHVATRPDLLRALGSMRVLHLNSSSHVPTMTSYRLDLRGPSVNIQTACSSALAAVHYACQSLLALESDMAIAGAVNVSCPGDRGYLYEPESILSPDGRCRPFDESASGTLFADGLGLVVLRRLSDAIEAGDNILAVIRGSAINNDGAGKAGYTAPSVQGQAEVIAEAHAVAGVTSDEISYVEAHGTGTAVGDPIELTGLEMAFGAATTKGQHCAVGSIKGNLGHTNTVAGLAGLAKVVLALTNEELPASINCSSPTKKFDFARSHFHVAQKAIGWPRGATPRIAGVSSFGMGGTNVHLVVEEAPERRSPTAPRRRDHVFVMSARSRSAVAELCERWRARLGDVDDADLGDLAYTSRHGRRVFEHRAAFVGHDRASALAALRDDCLRGRAQEGRSVVFMFPGQGSQFSGMGTDLYAREPAFRAAFDRCASSLKRHDRDADLQAWTFEDGLDAHDRLRRTDRTQPTVFALSYALAELWRSWGVAPSACLGHSMGEYVAACCAGVMTPEEAIVVVAERGRLMTSMAPGAMIAIRASEAAVRAVLEEPIELAAVNGPELTVVTGPDLAVSRWAETALAGRWDHRALNVSHAFHSAMMDPILPLFEDVMRRHVRLRAPSIPFVSSVTGSWITASEAVDPAYWARQLRSPVQFAAGLRTVCEGTNRVLVEVGPGDTLSGLARAQVDGNINPSFFSFVRAGARGAARPEGEAVIRALAGVWTCGVPVSWSAFDGDDARRRAVIPTYPFEMQRYWVEPAADGGRAAGPMAAEAPPAETVESDAMAVDPNDPDALQTDTERRVAALWADLLGARVTRRSDNFFELGGDSLLVTRMIQRARDMFTEALVVSVAFEASRVDTFATCVDELLAATTSAVEPRDPASPTDGHRSGEDDDDLDVVLGQVGVVEDDDR